MFASVPVDGFPGPLHLVQHTWQFPCFSVVLKHHTRPSWRPLKGAMSPKKTWRSKKGNCWKEQKRAIPSQMSTPLICLIFFKTPKKNCASCQTWSNPGQAPELVAQPRRPWKRRQEAKVNHQVTKLQMTTGLLRETAPSHLQSLSKRLQQKPRKQVKLRGSNHHPQQVIVLLWFPHFFQDEKQI